MNIDPILLRPAEGAENVAPSNSASPWNPMLILVFWQMGFLLLLGMLLLTIHPLADIPFSL